MTTQTNHTKLIDLLAKAEKLASEFQGGCDALFSSAEEFHEALAESINKLKEGDNTQLDELHLWFLPTSAWDDFVGMDGLYLGNEISEMLSDLTKTYYK